ncbi:EAL domain-containing protein [Kushneria aurantia]|uniref:EAL domain-containing protein n=1 Tax=Kushneria aurantia TaxID=504092 RepID=A0ABV6G4Y9_9GAMM|nr:EAL domain-containing protein [Kushneria aurantia]
MTDELTAVLESDSNDARTELTAMLVRCSSLLDRLEQADGHPPDEPAGSDTLERLLVGESDVSWEWNPRHDRLVMSPQWCALYHYDNDALEQTIEQWCERVYPADSHLVRRLCHNALSGEGLQCVALRLRDGNGSWRCVALRALGVRGEKSGRPIVVGVLNDITDQQFRDSQTGFGNAELLEQLIEDGLLAEPHQQHALIKISMVNALMLVESNHFATTCDLQRHIAAMLRGLLPDAELIALPDFNYALVLRVSTPDTLEQYLDPLTRALNRPLETRMGRVWLSHVIGVVRFAADCGLSIEEVRKRARMALHSARDAGVGSVHHYDELLQERVNRASRGEQLIRAALANDGVLCFLQPIVSLSRQGRVVAFEALMRLADGEGNIANPGVFIEAAESTGLIHMLSQQLIDKALLLLKDDAFAERFGSDFVININLSRQQLKDPALVDNIMGMIGHHEVDPRRVSLEITESAVLAEPTLAQRHLTRLREAGVCVALDDFGSGYSSLSQLCELPLDCVKIDRRFVMDLEHDSRKRHVMTAVLDLCRRLSFDVVVEGVEEAGTLEAVRRMGAEQIQGFIYARPMSSPDVLSRLQSNLQPLPRPMM